MLSHRGSTWQQSTLSCCSTDVAEAKADLQCNLAVAQETRMWETFTDCARAVQQGGKPTQYWSDIAQITQKVLCAIEQSALDGCCTKKLQW